MEFGLDKIDKANSIKSYKTVVFRDRFFKSWCSRPDDLASIIDSKSILYISLFFSYELVFIREKVKE